jgi:hypothetical protein
MFRDLNQLFNNIQHTKHMKKIMLALMGAIATLSGNAQSYVAPTHLPLVMPPASSYDVYGCVKTSSYGYDNVNFEVSPGTFAAQNLHFYSWNAANYTDGGTIKRNIQLAHQ